jgi:hypothetical protein
VLIAIQQHQNAVVIARQLAIDECMTICRQRPEIAAGIYDLRGWRDRRTVW